MPGDPRSPLVRAIERFLSTAIPVAVLAWLVYLTIQLVRTIFFGK